MEPSSMLYDMKLRVSLSLLEAFQSGPDTYFAVPFGSNRPE